jgi:hypothetical protein
MSDKSGGADYSDVVVDLAKLRDYCLSEDHPRGRHKARVFRSRLGLTSVDALELRRALLSAVKNQPDDLMLTREDEFGRRYQLDASVATRAGSAVVRTVWIIGPGESVLRMITCYVL